MDSGDRSDLHNCCKCDSVWHGEAYIYYKSDRAEGVDVFQHQDRHRKAEQVHRTVSPAVEYLIEHIE